MFVSATLCGTLFFPALFALLHRAFRTHLGNKLSAYDINEICIRCVSSIQATVSCTVGFIIIRQTGEDIMHDRHWLTNSYACFALPYFVYDLWAMFRSHRLLDASQKKMDLKDQICDFILSNKLMAIHHVVLPSIFFPIIIFFRKDLGDFFVGVLYLFEMAIPFIAARFILAQLKLKDTPWYVLSALLMILTFAISRVVIFPYLYWTYANYAKISLLSVPLTIPIKCNVGCLFVLIFQLYWLLIMVRGAFRALYKIYLRHQRSYNAYKTTCEVLSNQQCTEKKL